jgi:hypothetical protein
VAIAYSSQQIVAVGPMNVVCPHCKAEKFKNEAPGLCCASGQVKSTPLIPPPEPLHSLVSGFGPDSIHFLTHIQQYNNCFQMTFGATKVIQDHFMPTFIPFHLHKILPPCGWCKIRWQLTIDVSSSELPKATRTVFTDGEMAVLLTYFASHMAVQRLCYTITYITSIYSCRFRVKYRTGSLLPTPDRGYKFLHIYFMGDSARQVDTRCAHNNSVKRPIVEQLQTFFHQHNGLTALFNHKIVIRADQTPAGQHARCFNAPTIDEVAIVVVGENLENRDIVSHRRNDQLQRVSETLHFAMKLINPVTGK